MCVWRGGGRGGRRGGACFQGFLPAQMRAADPCPGSCAQSYLTRSDRFVLFYFFNRVTLHPDYWCQHRDCRILPPAIREAVTVQTDPPPLSPPRHTLTQNPSPTQRLLLPLNDFSTQIVLFLLPAAPRKRTPLCPLVSPVPPIRCYCPQTPTALQGRPCPNAVGPNGSRGRGPTESRPHGAALTPRVDPLSAPLPSPPSTALSHRDRVRGGGTGREEPHRGRNSTKGRGGSQLSAQTEPWAKPREKAHSRKKK